METCQCDSDDILFREGDVADAAYLIVSGSVELSDYAGGQTAQRQVKKSGDVFGETALFDAASLYSATAKALEASELIRLTPPDLSAWMQTCPEPLRPFLALAFEKMKHTRGKSHFTAPAVAEGDIKRVVVAPDGEKMQTIFTTLSVDIIRLPFRIGGYPEGSEINRRHQLHLYIPSHSNPLLVSRQHCEIALENGILVLNDLGSRFCTTVNGIVIGRGRSVYQAPLHKGRNTVWLGTNDTPYRLVVTCE